jgi:predicted secreted protein
MQDRVPFTFVQIIYGRQTPVKRLAWFVCLLLAVAALACVVGCKPDGDLKTTKTVTEKDFGKTVYLKIDQTLGITLVEPRGSSSRWQCTWSPPPRMELVREVLIREAPNTRGAGGERHFILRVLQPGRITVFVQHGRQAPRSYIVRAS